VICVVYTANRRRLSLILNTDTRVFLNVSYAKLLCVTSLVIFGMVKAALSDGMSSVSDLMGTPFRNKQIEHADKEVSRKGAVPFILTVSEGLPNAKLRLTSQATRKRQFWATPPGHRKKKKRSSGKEITIAEDEFAITAPVTVSAAATAAAAAAATLTTLATDSNARNLKRSKMNKNSVRKKLDFGKRSGSKSS
jgi:hypothetical protein